MNTRRLSRGRRPGAAAGTARLVVRSALLGVAAGGRSSLGFAAPALTGSSTPAKVLAVAGPGFEVYQDKQPGTPSRLASVGLPARIASGAGGAVVLARREHRQLPLPVLAGAVGAVVGALTGASRRAWAAEFVPDWQAAVVEDVASVTLGVLASR